MKTLIGKNNTSFVIRKELPPLHILFYEQSHGRCQLATSNDGINFYPMPSSPKAKKVYLSSDFSIKYPNQIFHGQNEVSE